MRRQQQQKERQKGNRLLGQTTTLHLHNAFFCTFFAITAQLRHEKASFLVLRRT